MTEIQLRALRLTCPDCGLEYDDTTAETEGRSGYAVFRCPHCHEGAIALAVWTRRRPWPHLVLPEEDYETLFGPRAWDGTWRWPWRKKRRTPK